MLPRYGRNHTGFTDLHIGYAERIQILTNLFLRIELLPGLLRVRMKIAAQFHEFFAQRSSLCQNINHNSLPPDVSLIARGQTPLPASPRSSCFLRVSRIFKLYPCSERSVVNLGRDNQGYHTDHK